MITSRKSPTKQIFIYIALVGASPQIGEMNTFIRQTRQGDRQRQIKNALHKNTSLLYMNVYKKSLCVT